MQDFFHQQYVSSGCFIIEPPSRSCSNFGWQMSPNTFELRFFQRNQQSIASLFTLDVFVKTHGFLIKGFPLETCKCFLGLPKPWNSGFSIVYLTKNPPLPCLGRAQRNGITVDLYQIYQLARHRHLSCAQVFRDKVSESSKNYKGMKLPKDLTKLTAGTQ